MCLHECVLFLARKEKTVLGKNASKEEKRQDLLQNWEEREVDSFPTNISAGLTEKLGKTSNVTPLCLKESVPLASKFSQSLGAGCSHHEAALPSPKKFLKRIHICRLGAANTAIAWIAISLVLMRGQCCSSQCLSWWLKRKAVCSGVSLPSGFPSELLRDCVSNNVRKRAFAAVLLHFPPCSSQLMFLLYFFHVYLSEIVLLP